MPRQVQPFDAVRKFETAGLPESCSYQRIGEAAAQACRRVDPRYTDRFLEQAQAARAAETAVG